MYIGRFAPSPTGALHFGSLLAALSSFLEAKSNNGQWLLRIDDIDPPRELTGASQQIITTLQIHGLAWDKDIIYQSNRHSFYLDTLNTLKKHNLVYPCKCSRKEIISRSGSNLYDGHCSALDIDISTNSHAWRFKNNRSNIEWMDGIHALQSFESTQLSDFILLRRDKHWAYQLAVTVDDAQMGITHIVRGSDLLTESAKQMLLIKALKLNSIHFSHIPVITNQQGQKLSKQSFAEPLNNHTAAKNLYTALQILGQTPDKNLLSASIDDILQQAILKWIPANIPLKYSVTMD